MILTHNLQCVSACGCTIKRLLYSSQDLRRLGVPQTLYCCLSLTYGQADTVKFVDKERFDKEQIGIKELFPVTKLPFT